MLVYARHPWWKSDGVTILKYPSSRRQRCWCINVGLRLSCCLVDRCRRCCWRSPTGRGAPSGDFWCAEAVGPTTPDSVPVIDSNFWILVIGLSWTVVWRVEKGWRYVTFEQTGCSNLRQTLVRARCAPWHWRSADRVWSAVSIVVQWWLVVVVVLVHFLSDYCFMFLIILYIIVKEGVGLICYSDRDILGDNRSRTISNHARRT